VSEHRHRAAVDWLRRLVGHRTIIEHSNLALIEDVRACLDGHGAATTVIPGTRPGTANLYATIGPADTSGVILSAHTDVVAAPPSGWTSDPFELSQRGSRLYGRGTTDMKGFLAVALAAVPDLVVRDLRRPIGIALSADEEMGVRGVGPLLDVLAASSTKPLFCVVGEPTSMHVVVAHKGKIAFRVRLNGRVAHSSTAPEGVNAIAHAADLIRNLYDYRERLASQAADPRFTVSHASVNVGRIEGGTSVNVVAGACEFDIEYRFLPDQDSDEIAEAVRSLAVDAQARMRERAPEARVIVEILARYPGLNVAGNVPELVASLAGTDHGACVDFGTEAGLYQQRLRVPVVVCGPGDVAQAHTVDEFIDEDELVHCERFLDRLADWLCAT
jgi:acetylornithine deacetylase